MKSVSYSPTRDQLTLRLGPLRDGRKITLGRHSLHLDARGNLVALEIRDFTQELREFERALRTARLGGLWKGVRVDERDLREAREALLRGRRARWH
jgi:hypothetical protein